MESIFAEESIILEHAARRRLKLSIEKSSSLISSFLGGDFFFYLSFFVVSFRGKAIPGLSAWSSQRNPRKSGEAGLRPFIPSQSYCFFKVTGLTFQFLEAHSMSWQTEWLVF